MKIHTPLSDPIEELRQNVALPFEEARAMPKSVYTSEIFAEAEIEKSSEEIGFALAVPIHYPIMAII